MNKDYEEALINDLYDLELRCNITIEDLAKDICGDIEGFCRKAREEVINEFCELMSEYYWDSEVQSSKDDPCIVDAMIDLAIRTAKQLKE